MRYLGGELLLQEIAGVIPVVRYGIKIEGPQIVLRDAVTFFIHWRELLCQRRVLGSGVSRELEDLLLGWRGSSQG